MSSRTIGDPRNWWIGMEMLWLSPALLASVDARVKTLGEVSAPALFSEPCTQSKRPKNLRPKPA